MHLTADSIALRPADFYKEHDIELQLGKQVCKKNINNPWIRLHLYWEGERERTRVM